MFHVLLRRLTPRHPPYALSSFLLPDAERFCFHFVFLAQATATRQLRRPDVSSRFFLLFAMRLVMCWLRAPGPRPRKSVSSVSALSAERWAGTNSGAAFGSQTSQVWPPSVIFVVVVCPDRAQRLRKRQNSPAHRRAARKSANRSVGKKLFSSGGVSSQQVLVCPERMMLVAKAILATEE